MADDTPSLTVAIAEQRETRIGRSASGALVIEQDVTAFNDGNGESYLDHVTIVVQAGNVPAFLQALHDLVAGSA